MTKEFDSWNERKQQLDIRENPPHFKEREVWWCSVGLNVGTEQDGKGKNYVRPVLVLRKFSSSQFVGIPSTRSKKTSRFYHLTPTGKDTFNFILSQMRVFDSKRLSHRLLTLSNDDIADVKKSLVKLYGF